MFFAWLLGSLALAAPAQAAIGENTDLPLDSSVFIQCTPTSQSDLVHLTGTIHILFHLTNDATGGIHLDTTDNYQDVSGVGLLTGVSYHAMGTTTSSFTANGGPFLTTFTGVDDFRIIGQGQGVSNNFTGHATLHFTVNADGTLTAVVSEMHGDCG